MLESVERISPATAITVAELTQITFPMTSRGSEMTFDCNVAVANGQTDTDDVPNSLQTLTNSN